MGWECINGLIREFIKESGIIVICKDMDFIKVLMGENIWVNFIRIKSMVSESIFGRMVDLIKDILNLENNMD